MLSQLNMMNLTGCTKIKNMNVKDIAILIMRIKRGKEGLF
ncbi:hypothetical protein B4145_1935 [Bacillus subtilis]|uniref:Uncharacterized protein n=1 Tax=Bacillus subtilis subsp. subtilis TaxID=135461 RepID=A0ABD3ZQM1_BACIU|nr:hypothetical protein B4067_4813 [Bacillus subtilis subsp. subtilis]KIN49460.1 hypothetical protein B4145_1935 [Bacillus subtilis]